MVAVSLIRTVGEVVVQKTGGSGAGDSFEGWQGDTKVFGDVTADDPGVFDGEVKSAVAAGSLSGVPKPKYWCSCSYFLKMLGEYVQRPAKFRQQRKLI